MNNSTLKIISLLFTEIVTILPNPFPHLGAVHILRNTLWGGRGLPNLLQYYIGALLKVYYNIADLVEIWKGLDHFQYFICFYVVLKVRSLSQIWRKKFANMRFEGGIQIIKMEI